MNKNTIIISIVSVLLIFGFLGLAYVATNKPAAPLTFTEVNKLTTDEHMKWSTAKKNILVEYSDLQCPACRAFHEVIKEQIESDKKITDNITFVYRHFPLAMHEYADEAAYAAEAAGMQGKFFEMVDLMFETQDDWAAEGKVNDYFLKLAQELKLDLPKFKEDVTSDAVRERVARDLASGRTYQVQATPSFYLNGVKLDNIKSFEDFKKLLQDTAAKQ